MQNFTIKSGAIIFKIWLFALLSNTVIGSFILGRFTYEFFMYFFWGGVFGGISSIPILFILWPLLNSFFLKNMPFNNIIKKLFLIGVSLAIIAFIVLFISTICQKIFLF